MRVGTVCPIRRSLCSNRHASMPDMSGNSASMMIVSGRTSRTHSPARVPVWTWTTM